MKIAFLFILMACCLFIVSFIAIVFSGVTKEGGLSSSSFPKETTDKYKISPGDHQRGNIAAMLLDAV